MELRQIKYFLAVAEYLHFGNAAKSMNISQPPLSQQIKQLENEIGVKLINRTSRSVELTPQGLFLKKEAKAILERLEKAVKTTRAIASGESGMLSVAFVVIVTQTRFPELIQEYRSKWPDVSLDIMEMSTMKQLELIKKGELDIGFVICNGQNFNGMCKHVFLKDKYLIALPENHPLKTEKEISLKDLKGETLIMFKREDHPELFDAITESFARSGASPEFVQETNSRITALALVSTGMGVCPVSSPAQKLRKEGIIYKPIKDPFPELEVAAVWSGTETSPQLESFINIMEKYSQIYDCKS